MDELIKEIINEEIDKLINESFKTPTSNYLVFRANAVSKKRKYANVLWNIIQKNYADIGGCKSFEDMNGDGGFNDFVNGRYIWKVYFDRNRQPVGIIVYRPTGIGRKMICMASNQRYAFDKLVDSDLRGDSGVYGEVSGKPEHILRKNPKINWIDNDKVQGIFDREGGWKRYINLVRNKSIDDKEKIPYDPYTHYYRMIGGGDNPEVFRKAMYGPKYFNV